MFCWKCGTKNEAGQKFCSECGALLEVPVDEDGEAGTVMLNKSENAGEAGTEMLNSSGEAGTDMLNQPGGAGTDMLNHPGEVGTGYDDYYYDGPGRSYDDYDDYDGPGRSYDDYNDYDGPGRSYDDYDVRDMPPRGYDGYDTYRSNGKGSQRRSRSSGREKDNAPGRARRMPVAALIIGLLISAAAVAAAVLWYFHIGPFKLTEQPSLQTETALPATPTPVLPGISSPSGSENADINGGSPAVTTLPDTAAWQQAAPEVQNEAPAPETQNETPSDSSQDEWDVW